MERLVTTAQAAEILGISLQGVHYRIKNKKLKSIKQGGKTYVYVPNEAQPPIQQPNVEQKEKKQTLQNQKIIELKDEQISMLKKSIKWLRRQHKDEIERLETNHNRAVEVFNSEIKLLQSAFNEMRSIYKPQIQMMQEITKEKQQQASQPQEPKVQEYTDYEAPQQTNKPSKFISLQDFSLYLKKNHKTAQEIKMIILKAVHRKDPRFMYNKKTKKVLILNKDFSDLL